MAEESVLARRRSPLHRHTAELAACSGAELTLREIPFLAQIGLRAEPGSESATALQAVLGGPLPRGVGVVTALNAEWSVLWLGPDEFLLVAPDEAGGGPDPGALVGQLAAALGDRPGHVLDLSANRTTLELHGIHAQAVLDTAVRVDLDPVAFPSGSALVTLMGGVGVILWRTAPQTIRLMPRSSFAVHAARWLLDAMREYV